MKKIRNYPLTLELLNTYRGAALANAADLLEEAQLLLSKKHYARAYFLALAAIEETGKAYLAFDASGRNLTDAGVCKKVKEKFEDHSSKITSAFVAWISFSGSQEEALKTSVDLMIHLKRGREKSMYIDVKECGTSLSIPREVVRTVAAMDCVRLAANCLHHTKLYIDNEPPPRRTSAQDKFLCLKQSVLTNMLNTEDFWEFYISHLNQGVVALEKIAITYHDGYYQKGLKFKQ